MLSAVGCNDVDCDYPLKAKEAPALFGFLIHTDHWASRIWGIKQNLHGWDGVHNIKSMYIITTGLYPKVNRCSLHWCMASSSYNEMLQYPEQCSFVIYGRNLTSTAESRHADRTAQRTWYRKGIQESSLWQIKGPLTRKVIHICMYFDNLCNWLMKHLCMHDAY